MSKRELLARTGLWLTCGGLTVLAAHHLLTVYEPELSVDSFLLLGGALVGYLITATGIWLSIGCRSRGGSVENAAPCVPAAVHREQPSSVHGAVARRMAGSFLAWHEHDLPGANPWNSFDQLVREMLAEQLGALRVRCYEVLPGEQELRSLSQLGPTTDGKCARRGILGHVATTGQEFVAADPAHGELVHQLAEDADDPWEWVFPIRAGGQTVGLVAVGKLSPATRLDRDRREDLSCLITAFWAHVACLQRLSIAERTDKASGLLTRTDFFQAATRALAESYAENEPVVLVVLALEGLRRLDDVGRWGERDALVENIGLLIKRRIRTDDVIGRFSDDRFVILLRRLDSGLGRLIAAKIQDTAQEQIAQLGEVAAELRVRAGLTGSGFKKPPLDTLLVSAFEAARLARKQGVALHCDLATAAKAETAPLATQDNVAL